MFSLVWLLFWIQTWHFPSFVLPKCDCIWSCCRSLHQARSSPRIKSRKTCKWTWNCSCKIPETFFSSPPSLAQSIHVKRWKGLTGRCEAFIALLCDPSYCDLSIHLKWRLTRDGTDCFASVGILNIKKKKRKERTSWQKTFRSKCSTLTLRYKEQSV